MNNDITKYTDMQQHIYESLANTWSINNRDPVVGTFDRHNHWKDYDEFLFKDCINFSNCLDFGCGPGRNLVKYGSLFENFDGVDISQNNLDNAIIWLQHNNMDLSKHKLYKCNGYDLSNIENNIYDIVMSTITLQHICVYEIRKKYFEEFYRVLRQNGTFTAQMGFGKGHPNVSNYYDNYYDAQSTNGQHDVMVDNPEYLEKDLLSCGFVDFKFYIRPRGPGDAHPNWIFFNAKKI